MADPLIGAPKAQPRSKKWVEAGIAKNPAAAKRRIAAARRTRPKRDIRVTMQFQNGAGLFREAMEAFSDHLDMSRSRVLGRFVEDGLRGPSNPTSNPKNEPQRPRSCTTMGRTRPACGGGSRATPDAVSPTVNVYPA